MTTLQPDIVPRGAAAPDDAARAERALWRQAILGSALFHLLILLFLLAGLTRQPEPPAVPLLRVAVVPERGAEGPAGGDGGAGPNKPMVGGGAAAPSVSTPEEKPDLAPEPAAPLPEIAPQPLPPPLPPAVTQPTITPTPLPTIPAPAPAKPTPKLASKPTPRPPAHRQVKPVPKPAPQPTVAPEPVPGPTSSVPVPLPPAAPSPPREAATPAAPGTSTGLGGAAGPGKGETGTGAGAGADRGIGDDYLERLQRYLRPFLRYPREARERNQKGTVWVGFTIARDGTVSDLRVEKSSGFPLIDDAALDTIRRAAPLPPLPDTLHAERMNAAIPVEFKLGLVDQLF